MAESLSETIGERALWQEVLLRAILDARLDPKSWPIPKSSYVQTAEARDYITTPSRDLSMVCALAGLDMQAVIDRMRVQIANAPAVEELVKMNRVERRKAA